MKCYLKFTKEHGRRLYVEFNNRVLHFDVDFDAVGELYTIRLTPTMLETIMKLINGTAKK